MIEQQKTALTNMFVQALEKIGVTGVEPRLERPKVASHGDLACTVALQCAKMLKKNPREVAQMLVEALQSLPEMQRATQPR